MPNNPTAAQSSVTFEATFPPMYYDSPVNQMVNGFNATADDSLTAAITAGSPYITVSAIDVCEWVLESDDDSDPSDGHHKPIVHRRRVLSDPIATSDGVRPLDVKKGQHARLWVTAKVPKGASLPPGKLTGTVVLRGKSLTHTGTLTGTYLGTLMGKVLVQPSTVVPGQPVLVQVEDAFGKPLSDPSVTVTIQGVMATARYHQFPTVGNRNLVVRAVRGALSETTQATVAVAGKALAFRASLTPPTVTEIPMLQVARVPGKPYSADFRLGTTAGVRRVLATAISKGSAAHATTTGQAAAAPAAGSQTPADALGVELAKVLKTLPAEKVIRIAPQSRKTPTGTATTSAVLAAIGGLKTKPDATSYRWDFGDGQTLTTQSPTATHDYFPAIQADKIAHSFHVSCTIMHDNVTVRRTLVLHSSYGLCRRHGVIVPPVTATATYATFQHVAFSASLIVHNLEASSITISAMACVPLSDDGKVALAAPKFTSMNTPVVIAGKSASALGIYIPLSHLKLANAVVNGFTVHYTGAMPAGDGKFIPVRFSRAFRIPLTDSGLVHLTLPVEHTVAHWDLGVALKAVSAVVTHPTAAVSKAGDQVVDTATNTIAIALSADPKKIDTLVHVRSAVEAGLTHIALKTGALTTKGSTLRLPRAALRAPTSPAAPRDDKFDPLNPPPVSAGQECYPDDITDAAAATAAAQQLVCQLTNDPPQTVPIPSSFENAQAGDIILSPAPVGGGDLIAAMFKALTPPQHHGHSGIMTANFFEITHCTASPERITKNTNKDAVGIPTSLNGNMLQYAWPGSLTQSIDDATSSVSLKDPSGVSYTFNSFNADRQGDGSEIIYPLVVKPLPEHEAKVRPLLRKAADTARSKGAQYDSGGSLVRKGGCYYSFYAYTNPQLSAGFTDAAGADAGWARGLSPAVCSSFVWLCLKEHNIPLVTSNQFEKLSDFSASDVASGAAQVGPATLDGLIFYPQVERLQAGQALRQMLMNQALDQEDGFGSLPGINETIAGPIADQLLNMFASGNPNLVGSSAWRNPGDGNAVSPDNIRLWKEPHYGYAEPLQYLPRHTEQYTISRWTKVISWGAIKGTVRYDGAPVPNAHVWVYLPGGDAYTGADGTYTLNHIPIGTYKLKAQAVVMNGVSAEHRNGSGQPITLTKDHSNIVQDIELQGNLQSFRRLDLSYSISCDHWDLNPFSTKGVQTAGPFSQSREVNPGLWTNSLTYRYDYNGGGYFHIDYTFTIALLGDFSIEVTLEGKMYNAGSDDMVDQYTVGPFNVPMGGTWSGWMKMEHSNGYRNGPANLTFSVTNNQQTG
jgi:hypothetical protein